MSGLKINKVFPEQAANLQCIARKTFSETFSDLNTEEDMKKYLEEDLSIEKIRQELDDRHSEFYFCQRGDEVIGYMKVNFGGSQTELKDNRAIEIERFYVLRDFHGKYIGQMLFEKAIEIAKSKNAEYIWLGVWERNPRAIRFYEKNGFEAFDKHIFKLGNDEQTDIMMKLKLK